MNDDFEIVGDAAREARVVAVVLGEASDFEREEVARLCEENPELGVFRRRMEAVHGLIGESRVQNPESRAGEWRLSKERRAQVMAKLGEEETVVAGPKRKIRFLGLNPWQHAALIGVACVVVGLMAPTPVVLSRKGAPPVFMAEKESELPMVEEELASVSRESKRVLNETGSNSMELNELVTVAGQVQQPGAKDYKRGMTIKDALEDAGGVSTFGTSKRVTVYREGKKYALDLTNEKHRNERLYPGDTVEVDQVKAWESGGDSKENAVAAASVREPAASRDYTKPAMAAQTVGIASATEEAVPAAPSSSLAKMIGSNTVSPTAIPLPELSAPVEALDFGEGEDYGTGWGYEEETEAGGGMASVESKLPALDAGLLPPLDAKPKLRRLSAGAFAASDESLSDGLAVAGMDADPFASDDGFAGGGMAGGALSLDDDSDSEMSNLATAQQELAQLEAGHPNNVDHFSAPSEEDIARYDERVEAARARVNQQSNRPRGRQIELDTKFAEVAQNHTKNQRFSWMIDERDEVPKFDALPENYAFFSRRGESERFGLTPESKMREGLDAQSLRNLRGVNGVIGLAGEGASFSKKEWAGEVDSASSFSSSRDSMLLGFEAVDGGVPVTPATPAEIKVVREFTYPTEYEVPELPNQLARGKGPSVENAVKIAELERSIAEKKNALAKAQTAGSEKDAELVDLATEMHDYRDATREYESSLALLQELKLAHSSERVGLRTPREPITIQEDAKVPKKKSGFLGLGSYQSEAVVQVNSPGEGFGSTLGVEESRDYFQGQKEVIKSTKTLSLAAEELDLATKWGVSKKEVVKRLKKGVEVKQRRGTDLLEIEAKSKDPELAKDIAAAVSLAYQKRRNDEEAKRAEAQLDALDAEIENQKDKVEAKRKVLDTIVRIAGRPYFETSANSPASSETQLKMMAERNAFEMKKNSDQYKIYLDKLETLDSEQLLRYAAELPVDNNSVRFLHSELLAAQRELKSLSGQGLADRHPTVQVQRKRIEGLQSDVVSAVATLKESLQNNFELISEQLLVMEGAASENESKAKALEKKLREELAELEELKGEARAFQLGGRPSGGQTLLSNKLQNIILPRLDFEDTPLDSAIEFLTQKSIELDPDPDPSGKGLNFIIEQGASDSFVQRDLNQRKIDVLKLKNVSLASALESIAEKTGINYRIDEYVITLLPSGYENPSELETRIWAISKEEHANLMAPSLDEESDFYEFELSSEKEALVRRGLNFGPGTVVRYSPDRGILLVKSDGSNLNQIHQIVDDLGQKVKAVEITLAMDEKDAATQGDSTFSLHVSDVSFKLAKAALEQGKWPETVRVEEFVNAFSYGERALGPNERVGVAMEQAAHPFLSQRNLLRVSLQTAATGRGAGVPLRLTVVLDKSGSMERLDRAAAVDEAFRVLVEQLNPGDKVTLVGFSRTPTLLADHVDGAEGARLLEIFRGTPSEGGTNVEEALKLARAKAEEHFEEGAQNRVILLTDGIANLGESVPENLMTLVEGMRENGVAFDACGVGVEGLNDDILEALTRKGDGRYYLLGSTAESGADFAKQVAGALRPAAQNVKVQIEWNADRVGKWRLYGYEKHELKKEDFRNDSVDAAEMAAEEEGVALYHVEVKPDGEGPLGVARVRFLDVANDEMVEREWVIVHEGEAAALKEADDKMRLAGVAGLVAEKLVRSAVGERAEWDDLLEMTRQLKTVFPREERVKDLERMIEQAKGLE